MLAVTRGYQAPCRDFPLDLKAEFAARGFKERHFFPHRSYHLPKLGPDGLLLAEHMCGITDLNSMWEVVLYVQPPTLDEFPHDLFFDSDVIWHQQHFGLAGQVATANLVVAGRSLYTMAHVSDVFQRISRRRPLKTRVEKRLQGWSHMLLNSIFGFALEHRLREVLVPTAELALRHTDQLRHADPGLFTRIYDQHVSQPFRATRKGEWWSLDVQNNRELVVEPIHSRHDMSRGKRICICHDVERALGHADLGARFASAVDLSARRHLRSALRIEGQAGVKATYSVVGKILPEVRAEIESGGNCIAFHSYDHHVAAPTNWWRRPLKALPWTGRGETGPEEGSQLQKCRQIDYRVKGYRPPQSRITHEIADRNLAVHNFEWLASSDLSLRRVSPVIRNRVVKLPIHFDDYALYGGNAYADWEAGVFRAIDTSDFVVVSLHDCYGHLWLPQYRDFLKKLEARGRLLTLDAVSSEVILANAA